MINIITLNKWESFRPSYTQKKQCMPTDNNISNDFIAKRGGRNETSDTYIFEPAVTIQCEGTPSPKDKNVKTIIFKD
jgi:hypothetical protein